MIGISPLAVAGHLVNITGVAILVIGEVISYPPGDQSGLAGEEGGILVMPPNEEDQERCLVPLLRGGMSQWNKMVKMKLL